MDIKDTHRNVPYNVCVKYVGYICNCMNLAQDISMISMNVKQVYGEWYDTVSDNEIDSVCILREIIEVREGMAKCDIF